jgi:hypothetical protein
MLSDGSSPSDIASGSKFSTIALAVFSQKELQFPSKQYLTLTLTSISSVMGGLIVKLLEFEDQTSGMVVR